MGANLVVFSGNIGNAPEIKELGENKTVCTFSVANNRKWGKEEHQQETTWMDVETWGPQARFISEYGTKGREVTIIGRLKKDKWQDPEGNNRSAVKLVAEQIELHSARPAEAPAAAAPANIAEKLNSALVLVQQGIPQDVAIKAVLAE